MTDQTSNPQTLPEEPKNLSTQNSGAMGSVDANLRNNQTCICGHHSKDHSYKPDSKDAILYCDICATKKDDDKTKCKKFKAIPLSLNSSEKQFLQVGTQSNGNPYSVRTNRDRFFFPQEWENFYTKLHPQQKITFAFLINTGARINEANHVKVEDCDLISKRIILRVTKVKAAKKEKNPRPRIVAISSEFAKQLDKHIKSKSLLASDYIGILSQPAAHICLKKTLEKSGMKDYYMVSIHNIRKTHGNWLKALGVDTGEICLRLGHDMNTFLKNYGASNIFSSQEVYQIRMILGDLYRR